MIFDPTREVAKGVFDSMLEAGLFTDTPQEESADAAGYKDVVYMPDRRAWASTVFGPVWAWVRGKNVKREEPRP